MELSMVLLSKLTSMMLYVVLGFVLVRAGFLRSSDSVLLSRITVWVLQPCIIIHAMEIELTHERMQGFVACLIFSFAAYMVWILVSKVLKKPLRLDGVDEDTLVYSNVGNLVLPLISMVLGEEMVFYGSAIQIPFNLFIWTHGLSTIRGTRGIDVKRMLRNSNMIALLAGLVMLFAGVRLPEVIDTSVSGFASMLGPMSMLVVGVVIADSKIKDVLLFRRAYLILFGRLIVYPMLAMGLLYVSGIAGRYPQVIPALMVTLLSLCAPPSSTISQLAVVYDVQPIKAGIYNVLGTFLCVITMPLIILLYQMIFM